MKHMLHMLHMLHMIHMYHNIVDDYRFRRARSTNVYNGASVSLNNITAFMCLQSVNRIFEQSQV